MAALSPTGRDDGTTGDDAVTIVDLPDADVRLVRRIGLPIPDDALLRELVADTPWRSESITLFGKTHPQPRLTAWYGDDANARYAYSGIDLVPLPWTPLLRDLRDRVERVTGATFNSALLNLYRDGRDSIGMHSDDERELGAAPTIAALSLGATRTLVLAHRTRRDLAPLRIVLPSASLLVMRGPTQRHWKHGIRKQAAACGARVSLTFRRIVPV